MGAPRIDAELPPFLLFVINSIIDYNIVVLRNTVRESLLKQSLKEGY